MILSLFSQVDLDPPVGNVEHLVDRQAHDLGRARELPGPDFGAAPRAHLAPGQDDDSGFVAQRRQA